MKTNQRILIAEDDPVSCRLLEVTLKKSGYDVVVTRQGAEALAKIMEEKDPLLAILDWMMPELSGVDVCKKVREAKFEHAPYLMILTARGSRSDMVEGLNAGANDYLTKPFDSDELLARVRVGCRVLDLQANLAQRVRQLEDALANVKQLQGLLPICSYCKKIRDDKNYWQQVESYIGTRTDTRFSHSICPDCYKRVIRPQLERAGISDPSTPEASD